MNKIIVFAIALIVLLTTSFLINKCIFKECFENENENTLEKHQIKCKNIMLPSESFGLILDARIICDKIPDLDLYLGNRNIIIETTNKKIKPEDIIFVNLDWTNFEKAFSNCSTCSPRIKSDLSNVCLKILRKFL